MKINRKSQPTAGYPAPRKGPNPGIQSGGPGFSKDLPSTQKKDRSMGMKRVKIYPQKKGL